ncbi:MAG TPA: PDZ domain-containing protein [Thermoanaerobaculia bacterium]|nr:PDZ domain-containing protein [Thermoanaerobaculia bacterium]
MIDPRCFDLPRRRPLRRRGFLAILAAAALLPAVSASAQTKLLRYPDVHGDTIVFVYGGDLYRASVEGGDAVRLTSHAGRELYPKLSPDGSRIAFSAEYNGTRQVYVMPTAGGEPTQLTWYNDVGSMPPRGGTDYRVLDWTRDGRFVVVRANRVPMGEREGRPYLVPADGGMETPLPIPESDGGMLSPDGTKFVYTPVSRDFRTWKRYRGGRAQDVWVYDLENDTSLRLTDFPGTDHQPVWVGDTVYFVSDREYTLDLYAIPPTGGEPRRITDFDDFDVLWPSAGPDALVFENGGSIWTWRPGDAEPREVPIKVTSDRPATLPHWVQANEFVESFDVSPGGKRAVIGARGEIWSVPAEHGEPRNLSRTPAAREIGVTWSPDGRWIAYLSDASGEYEVYVRPQDGSDEPRRLTMDGRVWRFDPVWSPDSKKLIFGDKRQRLNLLDVESGRLTVIDTSTKEDLTTGVWSPDSNWVAYVKTGDSRNSSIWVYSLESGSTTQLTPDETTETSPAFDPEGRYLYFLSNRDYNLTFSAYEFNYLYTNAARVYAGTLAADGPALYAPKVDEVEVADDDEAGGNGDGEDEQSDDGGAAEPGAESGGAGDQPLRFDLAGFNRRVVPMRAPSGNYQNLSANASGVFFGSGGPQGPPSLQYLALDADEPKTVLSGLGGYRLSSDGQKILVRRGNDFSIVDAKPEADFDAGKLDLEHMELLIDPEVEWQQLYVDAWRTLRDWFYDPGMHGQDWEAIPARYAQLVPHVATRADLDYLFSEIAGEVNAGHIYVQPGDETEIERKAGGLLGAEIVADASGAFRIDHVFRGEEWRTDVRSPLDDPAVDAGEGDYILAVDGVSTSEVQNFYELLENKAGRQVELLVNDTPSPQGARTVRVEAIGSEQDLRYVDWVRQNRELVDRLSGGRIGYIHAPNTAVEGSREVFRGMVAYAHKDALIIDDRYNGGGFIPDRMVELLQRQPLNYWVQRGLEPNATPFLSHRGPKAMLINHSAGSGGDALPYYFKKLGLGPLIGTRTWGGLIGISGTPSLADGGSILAATFRFLDTDNQWAVENEGVAPDIEVIDRPELIAAGRDPSIEKAVEVLLEELERNPPQPVEAPPPPTEFPPR